MLNIVYTELGLIETKRNDTLRNKEEFENKYSHIFRGKDR